MHWDPEQYGRFAAERGRPFLDLLARVAADSPTHVVDLGCGPGNMTALLAERWPSATVEGLDSSPDMIAAAAAVPGVSFRVEDVNSWVPVGDVVVSNAVLQWVPSHADLIRSWCAALAPGSWLAWQVPANFDSPSHTLMKSLASSMRWRSQLAGVLRHDAVLEPPEYARLLLDAGWSADVWETTYLHVLTGADAVLEWVTGTGLRPILQALPTAEATEFVAEYARLLRSAYPDGPTGTLFPFRRIFAVGHKPI